MSTPNGTFVVALRQVSEAILQLDQELSSPERVVSLLEKLGVTVPFVPPSLIQLQADIVRLRTSLDSLQLSLENIDEWSPEVIQNISDLSNSLNSLFKSIHDLPPKLRNDFAAYADLLANIDLDAIVKRLVDYLIMLYVRDHHPVLYNILIITGIFEVEYIDETGDYVPSHTAYRIRVDRLDKLITDPVAVAKDVYGWGTAELNSETLLERIQYLLMSLGIVSSFYDIDGSVLESGIARSDKEIMIPLYSETGEDGAINFGFRILPIQSTSAGNYNGIAFRPYITGGSNKKIKLREGLTIELKGGFSLEDGVTLIFRPPLDIAINTSLPSGGFSNRFEGILKWAPKDGSRLDIVNQPNWFTLNAADVLVSLSVIPNSSGKPTLKIEMGLENGSLTIGGAKADGFLQNVLPKDGIQANFDLMVGWSNQEGLYFVGAAGLEVTLPIHKSFLGIFSVESIYLSIGWKDKDIQAILAANASFKLGPIMVIVERVGVKTHISFPPSGGNFGLANVELNFKPPDGAGLSLDAAAIVGGGYLYFDQKNEQYAGIIQLEVKGGIALKAIGLLTTRLPDGSKGFSLVIIISAEFPPIQLGFGFSLNGAGGLIGINRTMVVDVLRAGIKNHILDSILFPKDPVANATRIISDLQNVFPPIVGRYVFGPMAILAWGVPPMLTAELGILLELPAPVRLAILGKLKLVLPKEEISLILMQMDVIGIIDFDKGDVSVDATLYDSRIAQYVVSGDMAVRANFGASPTFALAAGGFNPRFQPPPNFPLLEQLAISLATGDNPRLRLEAYLALTSNTAQLGARLDLYAAADLGLLGLFSIDGYLGFDTLFQFSPFHFIVDIFGGISLKRNGESLFAADLAMSLEGPEPMHGWGKATFDFLGKRSIDFDITIGSEQPQPPLAESNPAAELIAALNDIRSWSAQLPADGHMLVTLRKVETTTTNEVLVHPLGNLTVHERIVPLGIEITKFGNTVPTGNRTFDISVIVFNNTSISVNDTIKNNFATKDYFSPNQFFDLTDDEKLSRPSFESFTSGYTQIGSAAMMGSTEPVSFGEGITSIFEYDTIVIDKKEDTSHKASDKYSMTPDVMLSLSGLGSAAKSTMANSGSNQFAGPKQKISLKDTEYVVSSVKDLTVPSGMKSGLTYTEAADAAKKKKDFRRSEDWQVTASHEVVMN
jgi:hypothetical protein